MIFFIVQDINIFTCNAKKEFAQLIANILYISISKANISSFIDGDVSVQIN